jgi:hypothetical protein
MSRWFTYFAMLLFLLAGLKAVGQESVAYQIQGRHIMAIINLNQPAATLDSIVQSFGFTGMDGIESQQSSLSWQLKELTNTSLVLLFDKNNETKQLPPSFVVNDAEIVQVTPDPFAYFGVNDMKSQGVRTTENGVVFTLDGFAEARSVQLSGTFNEWSTLRTPMQRTANGWQVTLDLPAGKHLYKFIVDGRWMHDKRNRLMEPDGNKGYNSVYYVYNYAFSLPGFKDAKRVELAGSFNGWNRLRMKKDANKAQWRLPMYLREGTHAYKFVVDGDWILDPTNDIVRSDGMGNENSFMSVGDTFYFVLKRFPFAKQVFVAGNFNAWNFGELQMQQTDTGWVLPYVLAAGNYEYKFMVDGEYVTDENNPVFNGSGDYQNSVLAIKPNTTFALAGYADAQQVLLSGSFNGWSETGYTMKRSYGQWTIKIYLPKGKHTYKFKADDSWLPDPENPLWERNQYDTRNSVIWIDDDRPVQP